jgi:ABC-2 type transport system ATP-binding protein
VTATATAAIAAEGLRKSFEEVVAVDGISFEVAQGEVFGLVGPNGAGKTTTLEMIEGLRPPDAGGIHILGEPVWPHPQRVQPRIGVQLQTTALFDHLSARELLTLFGRFYGPVDPRWLDELLETVGLETKGSAMVNEMSGGQQQRLAIALALVNRPEIVFLDEPTTGLDPQARRNLWDVIAAVGAEGRTVVLTTHYLEEAEQLCDRVGIVDGGRLIALDTPAALVSSLGSAARIVFRGGPIPEEALRALPAVADARTTVHRSELVSHDSQATLAALLALAAERDAALADLSVRLPTLEDVFLTLTGREYRE